MLDYSISKIYPGDKSSNELIDSLLKEEGIRRDGNLDYTCAVFDDDMNVIATGSCFKNTLRCLAVSSAHQGEGLMNEIITHLTNIQVLRGNTHIFMYTKCTSSKFFRDLGFYEIARVLGINRRYMGEEPNSLVTGIYNETMMKLLPVIKKIQEETNVIHY